MVELLDGATQLAGWFILIEAVLAVSKLQFDPPLVSYFTITTLTLNDPEVTHCVFESDPFLRIRRQETLQQVFASCGKQRRLINIYNIMFVGNRSAC